MDEERKITKKQKVIISFILIAIFTLSMIFLIPLANDYNETEKQKTILVTNGTDQELNFNESEVEIISCTLNKTQCEHYMAVMHTNTTPIWLSPEGVVDNRELDEKQVKEFLE